MNYADLFRVTLPETALEIAALVVLVVDLGFLRKACLLYTSGPAATQFFIYTMAGSAALLVALSLIHICAHRPLRFAAGDCCGLIDRGLDRRGYRGHARERGNQVTPLAGYLLVAALLFSVGLAGALTRRNAILVLIGIELMLNAANLNLIAFWRYGPHPEALTGMMFAIFSIAVAAAEAAVGLGLVISIHRHAKTTDLDQMNRMKG